jgi:hypothetical protein
MRILLIAFLPALLLFCSCKKDKHQSSANEQLLGKWKLVRVTGGFAGIDMTANEWGHSVSYAFYPDHSCNRIMDGVITNDIYTLVEGLKFNNTARPLITFESGAQVLEYNFAHDSLVLSASNIADATAEWYVRQ